MIIVFAWKIIVYIFPCALIWFKWLDPSDATGFITVQNQVMHVLKVWESFFLCFLDGSPGI